MGTPTTITLVDDNTVSHVFVPLTVSAKSTLLATNDANTPLGEREMILGFNARTKSRPTDRISANLSFPVEIGDATDGYSVKDIARFQSEAIIPEGLTSAQRATFAHLAGEMITHAIIQGYYNRDPFYG
jgi:hypothetical protein